jgi:Tol biopolymer transport system component
MWTSLVTAARCSQGFMPPDCVRAVLDGTRNGQMVVTTKKPGLWLASARGRVQRRLTRGVDIEPAFSPNGRKLAFQRVRTNGRYAIMTVDVSSPRHLGGRELPNDRATSAAERSRCSTATSARTSISCRSA